MQRVDALRGHCGQFGRAFAAAVCRSQRKDVLEEFSTNFSFYLNRGLLRGVLVRPDQQRTSRSNPKQEHQPARDYRGCRWSQENAGDRRTERVGLHQTTESSQNAANDADRERQPGAAGQQDEPVMQGQVSASIEQDPLLDDSKSKARRRSPDGDCCAGSGPASASGQETSLYVRRRAE